ncbi:luciferin sulfotransferase-like [Planococcus citri]|uniref:luciferin sulfotransferase-like n=1 Tax=Planococcus citri TaxID=170843 RepID=UPI0031F95E4B
MLQKIKKIGEFDEETKKIVDTYYKAALVTGYVSCNGYMLTDLFPKVEPEISQLDVRDEDIWVVSYPKSGTTWTQETVWCIQNDLNFELSKKISLSERFPFLDVPFMINTKILSEKDPQAVQRFGVESKLQKINNLPSPRFIKSHLPLDFLPLKLQNNSTNAKIICITRNPRDLSISQYHHCQVFEGFQGTQEEFAELFIKGLVPYGPYWDHIYSYWNQRSKLNIIFIRFEDMKTKLPQTIEKISKFVGKVLTEEEINQLAAHVTFDNMKNIKTVNKQKFTDMIRNLNNVNQEATFMRSGQTHQWKTKLNADLIEKFEKWEQENLKGSDYELNYDEA